MCKECYVEEARCTPLLHPEDCLNQHTQYICGTCGRCICIEKDPKRGLQRWNFPFRSLSIAKLYLRAADYTMKKTCGIYEIENEKGRVSYKIFPGNKELEVYLHQHKQSFCKDRKPIFLMPSYQEFPNTEVRKLTKEEVQQYLNEMGRK